MSRKLALRLACLGMGIFNPNRRLCDGCHILKPTAALLLDLPRYYALMVQSKEIIHAHRVDDPQFCSLCNRMSLHM